MAVKAGNTEVGKCPRIASVRWAAPRLPHQRSQLLDVSSCYWAVTATLRLFKQQYKTWLFENRMAKVLVPSV